MTEPLWDGERINQNADEWSKKNHLTAFGKLRYAQHDMREEYEAERTKLQARIAELVEQLAQQISRAETAIECCHIKDDMITELRTNLDAMGYVEDWESSDEEEVGNE